MESDSAVFLIGILMNKNILTVENLNFFILFFFIQ